MGSGDLVCADFNVAAPKGTYGESRATIASDQSSRYSNENGEIEWRSAEREDHEESISTQQRISVIEPPALRCKHEESQAGESEEEPTTWWREMRFPSGLRVQLREGIASRWTVLWRGGRELSSLLVAHPELVHDRHVIEVGAGCAAAGRVAAALGAKHVVLTDNAGEVLANLTASSPEARVAYLDTTEDPLETLPRLGVKLDVCLASEVVWTHEKSASLLQFLHGFFRLGGQLALVAHWMSPLGNTKAWVEQFRDELLVEKGACRRSEEHAIQISSCGAVLPNSFAALSSAHPHEPLHVSAFWDSEAENPIGGLTLLIAGTAKLPPGFDPISDIHDMTCQMVKLDRS